MMLIYILGKPLDGMACPDQSQTQHLGHSHLWIFQHGRQTRDIDTVQCQWGWTRSQAHHWSRKSSRPFHVRYLGQSYTEWPSRFPWVSWYCCKLSHLTVNKIYLNCKYTRIQDIYLFFSSQTIQDCYITDLLSATIDEMINFLVRIEPTVQRRKGRCGMPVISYHPASSLTQWWTSVGPVVIVNQCTRL